MFCLRIAYFALFFVCVVCVGCCLLFIVDCPLFVMFC